MLVILLTKIFFSQPLLLLLLFVDCPQDERIPRHVNLPSSSSVAHHQDGYHSNQDIFTYFNQSLSPGLANLIDNTSPMKIIKTNCSLPQKPDSCSYVQFEALLNIVDRTVCKCGDSRLSIGSRCNAKVASPETLHRDKVGLDAGPTSNVSIFAVTPTYTRYTQKVDLTSLCYTIEKVANIIWIVVEDSDKKTDLVANLLKRCKVCTSH